MSPIPLDGHTATAPRTGSRHAGADGGRCPVCNAPAAGLRPARDEDYDYYWGGIRVPQWLALLISVPWRQQLDLLLIGFVIGLTVGALALVWGLLLAR